jgi:hypothetical protein
MINRIFKQINQLQKQGQLTKINYNHYYTSTTIFKKGCIIKTISDGKSSAENEIDLLKAVPHSFYRRECLSLVIDPTAFSSKDSEGKRHVLTKSTHIAGCIMTPFHDKIQLNENTVLSLVHGRPPKDEKDADIKGVGVVTKQDYQVPASFHSPGAVLENFKKMPRQGFFERFFIIVPIDGLEYDKAKFIAKIEEEVRSYKVKTLTYDRLYNACPHPILEVFGQLDMTKGNRYKAITPQRSAFFTISMLFNSELRNDFRAAAESSGLLRSELVLGRLLEKKNQAKGSNNTQLDPYNNLRPH